MAHPSVHYTECIIYHAIRGVYYMAYIIHCTPYNVGVKCTEYTLRTYSIRRTMYRVQCTVHDIHYTLYIVQYTRYAVQGTPYGVRG